MNNFEYKKAQNVAGSIKLVAGRENTKFLAGGTNLVDLWKYNITNPDELVDVNHLDELLQIQTLPNGALRLGASVKMQTRHIIPKSKIDIHFFPKPYLRVHLRK